MCRSVLLTLCFALLLAAAPSLSAANEPTPAATSAPDPGDAHADRVIVLPTAYTHPQGTFFVSDYEIVLVQAGYAITDRTQFSLTVTPPFEGGIVGNDVTVKTAVHRGQLVRAAVMASITGLAGNGIGLLYVGRVGGVVQLCTDPMCESSFSIGSNVTLAGPVLLAFNGVGGVFRVARRLSLLLEVDTVTPLGREVGTANGFAFGFGIRFPWRSAAIDLAFIHGRSGSGDKGTIPFLAATYRWLR